MMYLTVLHVASGSAIEAASAAFVVGPYLDFDDAVKAGETVKGGVIHNEFLKNESFYTIVQIPHTFHNPYQGIAKLLENWAG